MTAPYNTQWTPERIALLTQRWNDGHSATDIAVEFSCGLTRNAIIGKVSRLGLAKRKTVTFRVDGDTIVRSSNPKPRNPKPKRTAAFLTRRERLPDGRLDLIPPACPEVFTTEHFVTLTGLEDFHCRFPCWEDGAAFDQRFFCGAPTANVADGRPYCGFHSRIAYSAPTERKPQKYWRAA